MAGENDDHVNLWSLLCQLNAVQEGDPCVVAATGTVIIVIEDSSFSILEMDSGVAQSSRNFRGPGLDDHPTSPGLKIPVVYLVSYLKVGVLFDHPPGATHGRPRRQRIPFLG